jgi:glycosyltransferase involved in cell wall biosynthesis
MMSSLTEGLSNSLLEAMAMSLPVVTTDVGGTVELVDNGISGFLVSQMDPHALAQAVIALIGNDQLRGCIGQAARKRIEQKFSFANRLTNVEHLYECLLDIGLHRKYPTHPLSVTSS